MTSDSFARGQRHFSHVVPCHALENQAHFLILSIGNETMTRSFKESLLQETHCVTVNFKTYLIVLKVIVGSAILTSREGCIKLPG